MKARWVQEGVTYSIKTQYSSRDLALKCGYIVSPGVRICEFISPEQKEAGKKLNRAVNQNSFAQSRRSTSGSDPQEGQNFFQI